MTDSQWRLTPDIERYYADSEAARRLAAAAPDLLTVAEMVMAYHRGEIATFRDLVEPARAAIARARGDK